jgi:hypothetical protein
VEVGSALFGPPLRDESKPGPPPPLPGAASRMWKLVLPVPNRPFGAQDLRGPYLRWGLVP